MSQYHLLGPDGQQVSYQLEQRPRRTVGLKITSDGLLSNLALLFIPAGVGLVLHFDLLASEWWIILLALLISTILATIVTAALFQWLMKRVGGEN